MIIFELEVFQNFIGDGGYLFKF